MIQVATDTLLILVMIVLGRSVENIAKGNLERQNLV